MTAERVSTKAMPVQLNLDHVSPATRLLEKRRQMTEVQEALDSQKEEYAVQLPEAPTRYTRPLAIVYAVDYINLCQTSRRYSKREEAFKRREEQLRKKDLELQESLIRFNKFLKVALVVCFFGQFEVNEPPSWIV